MQVSPFDCMHGPAWKSQIYPPPKTSRPIISIMGSVWKVVGHELVGATPHPCTPWDIRRGPMRCRDAVAWRANWWRSEEAIWQREGKRIPFPLISFNFYSRYALPFSGLVMSSCPPTLSLKAFLGKGGLTHTRARLPYLVPSTAKKHEEGAHLITPLAPNFHDASMAALASSNRLFCFP